MNGQPLPATLPHVKDTRTKNVDGDPWKAAYKSCLQYEARAKTRVDHIRARVLGYLIREAPYDESRDSICTDIVDACIGDGDGALQHLADLYIGYFARLLIQPLVLDVTHTPSQCPSRPSSGCDVARDALEEYLELETPRSEHGERILKRDDHRCIVTGAYSLERYEECPILDVALVGHLEVAHILPRSIASERERDVDAGTSTVMQRFGRINPEELKGDLVHRPENVITLWDTIHSLFRKLQVWFEPRFDDEPYMCTVKTLFPRKAMPYLPESFTMRSTDPNLSKPSPDYFRLRAACTRVAHLSGTTQYVASMYSELDDQGVLAHDGSSAMMLHVMLSALVG